MKKFKISALILTAVLAFTPAIGCKSGTDGSTSVPTNITAYKDDPSIGKNKIDVSMNDSTELNETSYTINSIIDSGKRVEGLKYIYLDVTIKNNSDKEYEMNALNNFYLIMNDGEEVLSDIRADIYAKQSINDYKQLLSIPAGEEYNGYIGFLIKESVNTFTIGYFATGDSNDKSSVILCNVAPEDIIAAPEGMIKQ